MFSQRAALKINDGHHRWLPEGSRNPSIRASCTAGAAFAIHRQQVTVIKCFFISSQATTKGQNGIRQSGGMLALLMLRPFENALAMRGTGMLQARIMEQRDAEIGSAVWEPSSSRFYLHIGASTLLPCATTLAPASPPRCRRGLGRVQGRSFTRQERSTRRR